MAAFADPAPPAPWLPFRVVPAAPSAAAPPTRATGRQSPFGLRRSSPRVGAVTAATSSRPRDRLHAPCRAAPFEPTRRCRHCGDLLPTARPAACPLSGCAVRVRAAAAHIWGGWAGKCKSSINISTSAGNPCADQPSLSPYHSAQPGTLLRPNPNPHSAANPHSAPRVLLCRSAADLQLASRAQAVVLCSADGSSPPDVTWEAHAGGEVI